MNSVLGLKCVECSRDYLTADVDYLCPGCGGNLDVRYDYNAIAKRVTRSLLAADRNSTIWRYSAFLPVEPSSPVPPLTVGCTPIYECKRLASEYGVAQLLIKDEGRNPTASFKDRPSALAVVKAQEAGASVITTASSGNAGSALAGMCASVGMRSVIFVPAYAPAPKIAQLQIYGATVVLVDGSYDDAFTLCIEASRRWGWYQRSTGYNPYTREGKKTAALELAEQLNWQLPDKIFVAVGDGNIISGLWKGFGDLNALGFIDRLPKLIAVQAEGASPIVDAVNRDGVVRPGSTHTIADSINVGRPNDATMAIRAISESRGLGLKVSDDQIIAAIVELARATGVFAEPAAAAAFAGFKQLCEGGRVGATERILVVLTGNGLKDVESARRGVQEPIKIRPDIEELAFRLHL
jgi:threonine synthase